jgi:hypothetical protein
MEGINKEKRKKTRGGKDGKTEKWQKKERRMEKTQ